MHKLQEAGTGRLDSYAVLRSVDAGKRARDDTMSRLARYRADARRQRIARVAYERRDRGQAEAPPARLVADREGNGDAHN